MFHSYFSHFIEINYADLDDFVNLYNNPPDLVVIATLAETDNKNDGVQF